nr:hypothetical protein CFP56_36456 [Quercus suber]
MTPQPIFVGGSHAIASWNDRADSHRWTQTWQLDVSEETAWSPRTWMCPIPPLIRASMLLANSRVLINDIRAKRLVLVDHEQSPGSVRVNSGIILCVKVYIIILHFVKIASAWLSTISSTGQKSCSTCSMLYLPTWGIAPWKGAQRRLVPCRVQSSMFISVGNGRKLDNSVKLSVKTKQIITPPTGTIEIAGDSRCHDEEVHLEAK